MCDAVTFMPHIAVQLALDENYEAYALATSKSEMKCVARKMRGAQPMMHRHITHIIAIAMHKNKMRHCRTPSAMQTNGVHTNKKDEVIIHLLSSFGAIIRII